ncbi:MAG TPA: glycosyltransferase family protein [Candidatus Paceibacterota bacterium]|nr:glycosyltransferase family protein [Candidatus Paceibacterota bacterium]
MLNILGEGRGHMTQAIAVKEMVERAGHQVVCVVLGMGPHRQVPPFFASAMTMPIERIPTLDFSFKNNRNVSLPATLAGIVRQIPAYWRALRKLRNLVRRNEPDVIVNFFEPLTGIYALTHLRRPPVVCVAHQFMCGHPDYVRAPKLRLQQFGMKWYVRLVGAGSTKLALSFYEAPDLPKRNITVSPPILRRQLFELEPNPNGDFVLAYLLNHGYAEQIIEWHKKNPETPLHCFYDKPDAPPEFKYDDTLTFHRLDGDKFLRMMAQCKYVACTAGFESLSEAAYLGKPMFLMPVENHVEQQINAIDATRIGFGVMDKSFNLDRLAELPERLDNQKYRSWLSRADAIFLQTLERAVHPVTDEEHPDWHLEPQESKVG